jgi:hypothetical protein
MESYEYQLHNDKHTYEYRSLVIWFRFSDLSQISVIAFHEELQKNEQSSELKYLIHTNTERLGVYVVLFSNSNNEFLIKNATIFLILTREVNCGR